MVSVIRLNYVKKLILTLDFNSSFLILAICGLFDVI